MDQTFLQWLHAVYPAGRFDVLTASLESLHQFHGPALTHWSEEFITSDSISDTIGMQMSVETSVNGFQNETLCQFGVFLDLEQLTPENTHFYDRILRALYAADEYELPNAILSALAGDQGPGENLANMVAEICGGVADDYLGLIREVNPTLITKIKTLAEQKLLMQEAELIKAPQVADVDPLVRNLVVTFANEVEECPLTKYVLEQGKLGLGFDHYVALFAPYLGSLSQNFEVQSAKCWWLIVLMSDYRDLPTADIVPKVSAVFDKIYGNILRSMKVRNKLIALIGEQRPC